MNTNNFCVVDRFEPLTTKEWLTLPWKLKVDYLCYLWLANRGKHCKH